MLQHMALVQYYPMSYLMEQSILLHMIPEPFQLVRKTQVDKEALFEKFYHYIYNDISH